MRIYVDCNGIFIHIFKYTNMITIRYYEKSNTEISVHFEEKIKMRTDLPSKCIKNTIKLMATNKIKKVFLINSKTVEQTVEGVINVLVSILQNNNIKLIDIKYLKDIVRLKTLEISKANMFLSNIEKINTRLENKIEKMRKHHIKIKNSYSKKLEKFPKDIKRTKNRIEKMKVKDTIILKISSTSNE